MEIKEGQIYRHFKGALIKIICLAKHSETEELMVVYNHLDTNEIWVRPIDMFCSLVDKEKYTDISQDHRFELIDNDN